MDPKLKKRFDEIKARGITPEQEQRMRLELESDAVHDPPGRSAENAGPSEQRHDRDLYDYDDLSVLQELALSLPDYAVNISSLDELLERDKQREKDGFPPKIRVGRLVKPGKGGKDKVVVVPSTVEEKFIHDPNFKPPDEDETAGGTGEGEEGEVIGEQQVREEGEASGSGPGEGEGGPHEMESNAYDLGKILTDKFELPNLKDKGKKRSLTRYTYDLTDKNKGFGQILDKKSTLRQIVKTNIGLGVLGHAEAVDPTDFLISPSDRIYRVLSREKDYESQAMVFFVRDYSGSMAGKPTEVVVSQHVLIYSWLLYQYAKHVETRFILHDTEAKEAPDFYSYYNSKVAGGTQVSSAYHLVNEIVNKENLAQDYNIYVFHGTDGDDWDTDGKEAVPELKKMLTYTNRVGITIAERKYGKKGNTEVQRYLNKSGLLDERMDLIRLDVVQEDADEPRLIQGIKHLIS